jgi:two-component system chemotaxis response regulator CheY
MKGLREDEEIDFEPGSSTPERPEAGKLPQTGAARPPCRVLVVDDDELVRTQLATLLKTQLYDIEVAASGEEALRIMDETPCNIVLTDWQMPDMDGLSLCRYVRDGREDAYVYLMMLTVRGASEDILKGLASGVDDYIVKGTPIEELMARMEVARRITDREQFLRSRDLESRLSPQLDPATGARNFRYLLDHLPRELGRSQRYNHPLAVLNCEIDDFRIVTERYGREAGEDVSRTFVARAKGCIRSSSDWLARIGEQEYLIVLPETAGRGATRVAEKLRQVLAAEPVLTCAGPLALAASIGVVAVEPPHKQGASARIGDMLRAAERRNSDLSTLIDAQPVSGTRMN